jgi:glycerol-3-phosphate dehydrogenase (NAD(P)+)
MPSRRSLPLPTPGSRRAVVLGAGSFGTAVAVLLARGGFRTTLQTRTPEQAAPLEAERENKEYLADVALPRELRVEPMAAGLSRAERRAWTRVRFGARRRAALTGEALKRA